MTEEYHDAVARHYAAYRPPLHRLILQRQLEGRDRFRSGLDLGCGTGYSAVALTEFCDEVVGLDISRSMLDSASPHPQITYVEGRGDDLQRFPDGTFDIITFAGSLFYTRSEALRSELVRVGTPDGTILVYDFEAHLDDLMRLIDLSIPAVASDYDHAAGLQDWPEFEVRAKEEELVQLDLTEREAAHVLLADSNRYDAIAQRFPGDGDPFEALASVLVRHPEAGVLNATIYYGDYGLKKGAGAVIS